ncbi:MAG: hypothetical protein M3430_05990 [Acidobacteriota bacterium]|nr:hypothetical protein [Acidobacteriota bacterium]
MYCQTCGTQMASVLSYCPRCGAGQSLTKVSDTGGISPPDSPDSLIWAVVVSTIVVLGLILGGLIALKHNGVSDEMAWTFVAVSFLALIGVDAMFFRMLLGLRSAGQRRIDTNQLKEAAPRQLGEAQRGALGDPVPSVTEHTTRTFETALKGRGVEQQ